MWCCVPRQHDDAGIRLEGGDGFTPDRHHAQPVGHHEDAGRIVGRFIRRGGSGLCAADAGHRWRRVDPHPGRLCRHLRAQAVLRAGSRLSAVALRHGGPCGPDDAHGGRRLPDDERDQSARRARLDLAAGGRRGLHGKTRQGHQGPEDRLQPNARLRRRRPGNRQAGEGRRRGAGGTGRRGGGSRPRLRRPGRLLPDPVVVRRACPAGQAA